LITRFFLAWGHPEKTVLERYSYDDVSDVEVTIRRYFDASYYFRNSGVPLSENVNPLKHYIYFGSHMNLDPCAWFNTRFYKETHRHVDFNIINPLYHYIKEGKKYGSIPNIVHPILLAQNEEERQFIVQKIIRESFDEKFYRERYSDIKNNNIEPIMHYVHFGYKEGRDPNPWFSTEYYRTKYPHASLYNGIDPLTHFLIWGQQNSFRTFDSEFVTEATIDSDAVIVHDNMITGAIEEMDLGESDIAPDSYYNPKSLDIHWLIPNFDIGGGGHMTIFRMIHWLEYFGHKCTIWIQSDNKICPNERYDKILSYYQFVKADVKQYGRELHETSADVIVATSWDTAYHVDKTTGFKRKFYFVQDFEPYFYPRGSRTLLAEQTYDLDLDCLCASPWLATQMQGYSRWAAPFWLAFDPDVYFLSKQKKNNSVPRIALYGRGHSARRCVELGLLALTALHIKGVRFEVSIFGTHERIERAPFAVRNYGVLNPIELGELYRECDIGICFSATNYSLVPQEMMACGLPIVELDVDSTRAIFPSEVATLTKPIPEAIATEIGNLLLDVERREQQVHAASAWVEKHSWESAARSVEAAILNRLEYHSWQAASPALARSTVQQNLKASIVIPTLNGGKLFARIVEQISKQRTGWNFEIVVVDSGSTDGTVEILKNYSSARCISINKKDFQHGRTRNLGVEESNGEFVLFLTQDALPSDEFWLYNMVSTMEHFETAAGAFGKHLAWPDASFYTRRDIENHFKTFDNLPLLATKYLDLKRWNSKDNGFRQILRFYSDNNSCLRKSIWRDIPYPEVEYGEDQAWAFKIIEKGYGKIYAPNAIVYHSHDYTPYEAMERAKTESWFFYTMFGENLAKYDAVQEIDARNAEAERLGTRAGLSRAEIDKKRALNVAEVTGAVAGLYMKR